MTSDRSTLSNARNRAPAALAWVSVGAYALLLAVTQLLWLTYTPISTEAHRAMGVSEGAIGDLAVVVPILFVVLGIPSGRWLDRRYGATMAAGTLLTVGGALLRALDANDYRLALAGQVILAAGQPLLLNGITKLPARHIHPEGRVLAVSLLAAAQVTGILLAASTGSWLFSHGGLQLLVGLHGAAATVAGAMMLASLFLPARFVDGPKSSVPFTVRGNRQMWMLAMQGFIGVGLFNALATWLDTLETQYGNPGLGGKLITALTLAGIAGAVIIPSLAARHSRRRPTVLGIALVCTVSTPLLLVVHRPAALIVLVAVIGFTLISGLPILLDWSEILVGQEHAGAAAAFVLVIANLGGSVYVVITQLFIDDSNTTVIVLTLLLLPWVALARIQAPDPDSTSGPSSEEPRTFVSSTPIEGQS